MSGDPRVERNKATFRRLQEEVIVGGNVDILDEIFAPDFVTHRAGLGDLMASQGMPHYPSEGTVYEQFARGREAMVRALADQRRTIEAIIGEGDLVCARWRVQATHAAPLGGIPATGAPVEFTETGFLRFDDDGRIVEGWFVATELGLAVQMGLTLSAAPPAVT